MNEMAREDLGSSYFSQIAQLPATYEWASAFNVRQWTDVFHELAQRPLIAVGSGGSFSVAHYVSNLHEEMTGHLARAVTPLELISTLPNIKDVGVLLLTASGANSEIQAALRHSAEGGVECSRTRTAHPTGRQIGDRWRVV